MVIFLIEEKKDTESVGESALRLCVTPQRGPENCALLDVLFYFILEKLQLPGLATGVVRSSLFIPSLPVFPAPFFLILFSGNRQIPGLAASRPVR